jgi:RNA-directed DNA polymerase
VLEPIFEADFFLGYTFRYDADRLGRNHRYLNVFPSTKAQARARRRIHELTDDRWCFARAESVLANVNDFLRGWGRYFALGLRFL